MNQPELIKLKKIFGEIVCGFSLYKYQPPGGKDQEIYIKHLGPLDDLLLGYNYENTYADFKKRGVFTEQEKLDYLTTNKIWPAGNEQKIKDSKKMLGYLVENKRKVFKLKDLDYYDGEIKKEEDFLGKILVERADLLGETCEYLSQRDNDVFLIQNTIFSDSDLKTHLFNRAAFDEISVEETDELFRIYRNFQDDLSELNIKKIAISYFFTNLYYLTENTRDFFGDCIARLSHNKVRLVTYGGYFKNLLTTNSGVPDEVKDDPEKLEQWASGKRNIQEILDKSHNQSGVVSLPLTKQELTFYSVETGANHTDKIQNVFAQKNKGELSLAESIEAGILPSI